MLKLSSMWYNYFLLLYHSVMSNSFQPHGLLRFCSLDSPGKNTGVCSHVLLQSIFPDPRIEPRSPALQADSLLPEPPGKPWCSAVLSAIFLHFMKVVFFFSCPSPLSPLFTKNIYIACNSTVENGNECTLSKLRIFKANSILVIVLYPFQCFSCGSLNLYYICSNFGSRELLGTNRSFALFCAGNVLKIYAFITQYLLPHI